MRPRVVDWALFFFVTVAAVTGLGSLLAGRPDERVIFIVHAAAGLSLLILLPLKFRRVANRLRPSRWDAATMLSIGTSVTVLATVATGIVWVIVQRPIGYPSGMNLHAFFALLLIPFYLLHTLARNKPLRVRDLEGRRGVLRLFGVTLFGGAAWYWQERLNERFDTPGSRRRFTGSREAGAMNEPFPVTNWALDNPAPVDAGSWQLVVRGAVEQELLLSYTELKPLVQDEAVLDCTGGWYTRQLWQGVRVGTLLDQVIPHPSARYVRFISITGYRWSLPIAEAERALLATHVAGNPLSHWHGAPLRLVAPGRRGFQWVKWVTAVEVLTERDAGQWVAIFTSGL